jgi:hypothetical protein
MTGARQSNATRYAAARSRGAGIAMALYTIRAVLHGPGAEVREMELKENFLYSPEKQLQPLCGH